MKRISKLAAVPGLLALVAFAQNVRAADPIAFEDQVRPILKAHCFACHGEDGKREGKLDLRLVRFMHSGGESGAAIVAGKRSESPLFERIATREMPPEGGKPLTADQIELIGRWIDAGAKTRRPEPDSIDDFAIAEEDRNFWSFRPVQRPSVPDVKQSDWPAGPLDRFVLARLEAEGLKPSPRAEPRILARRLSFALTGLPPSPEGVADFAADSSPTAAAALVDRWQNSPRYGERWARFWLDLVRYVDQTPDYLTNADRAWLYRDWVVRSFNEDRPYDDFVRLQLAADQWEQTPPADLAALGLLGLSPTYWKELKLAPDVIKTVVAEEWDERIDAVTRTFLGLTVSCARCHNHKFDPVTVKDYYALAGIFASTQLTERPLLPLSEAEVVRAARKRVAELEAEIKAKKDPKPEETAPLTAEIERLKSTTPHYAEPWAHVVEDSSIFIEPEGEDQTRLEFRPGQPRDLGVFRRGNASDPGEIVPRRFLAVLCDGEPQPFQRGSGRRDLAEAILADGEGLAARVLVNRLWAQLFGHGLVRTTSDFGRQGDRPTHPGLLEYLAARLIEEQWAIRPLIREIVLSETFQQASAPRSDGDAIDPDNNLLWRSPRRRLDVEPWRDAVLSATGALEDRMSGPAQPLEDPANLRRTLYGKVVREEQNAMLRLFDFPEPSSHSPSREPTTTPLQQLFVLNGPLFQQQAKTLAAVAAEAVPADSPEERIRLCYSRLFQREPSPHELQRGTMFLQELIAGGTPAAEAWQTYCHALLSLNEMLLID